MIYSRKQKAPVTKGNDSIQLRRCRWRGTAHSSVFCA